MKIELTAQQRSNLIIFLQRLNLTGAEVPSYLEIVAALNAPFKGECKECSEEEAK